MSLKIGFDAKRAFHNFRGLGNYSRSIISNYHKYYSEDKLTLFSPNPKVRLALDFIDHHPYLDVVTPQSFLSKKLSSLWRSLFLSNVIKKYDLDIYHGLTHELPPFISKLDVKKVVTIHDLIFMRAPQYFSKIDYLIYKRKFSNSVKSADKIIAVCQQTKKDLISFLNVPEDKIIVLYQSCNPIFSESLDEEVVQNKLLNYKQTKPFILHVSALERNKNAIVLIKAFARIKDEIKEDLLILGRDSVYQLALINEIKKHGLESRVKIIHDYKWKDLPAFYQGASLFCMPSYFEGFGIPIVEAALSKTAVIASDSTCFQETLGSDGIFINPDDIVGWADNIKKVLEDEELRKKQIEKASLHIEKFSAEVTSQKLHEFYLSLV